MKHGVLRFRQNTEADSCGVVTASDVVLLADLSGLKLLILHRKQVTKIREPEGAKKINKEQRAREKGARKGRGQDEQRESRKAWYLSGML